MTKLPDKLSALLRLAVKDAQAVEKLPGYKLDMNSWYEVDGDQCFVCMAGAVMTCTLGVKKRRQLCPEDYDEHTADHLHAIDAMRCGEFCPIEPLPTSGDIQYINDALWCAEKIVRSSYDDDLDRASWDAYLEVADIFEEVGL